MTVATRSPIPSLVPESAPFTAEQRIWLNGLFVGLLSLDAGAMPISSDRVAIPIMPAAEDDAPWHDPAMPLAERMTLAEGRPLARRMMAAMAQQDCGQCGYNCKTYAEALADKKEGRINLCAPGGKDTARMLKSLRVEIDGSTVASAAPPTPIAAAPDCSRNNPVLATFLSRRRLNKEGSDKDTWHIELDLADTGLDYAAGDSLGIFPTNDRALADAILAALHAPPGFPIGGRTLRETLIDGVSLSPAPDMLFQLISYLTGGDRRKKAQALADGFDPDGDAATLDVLAALEKFPGIRPDPEALIESLEPLQPRVYSISSSPKIDPGRVSLTVDAVRYRIGGRTRVGVASTFLGSRVMPGDRVRVYVQKAQHFALPADPSKPIIMIGPGTGIAPFRAFLQERFTTGAPGANWLYFGHQRSDYDFFYEDELKSMRSSGHLTRLTLAWSRDADEKIYVQHRMRDEGHALWEWLQRGAHVYVCGDALRMAKDVERALIDIVAQHGKRGPEDAARYVNELKKADRYQADVY